MFLHMCTRMYLLHKWIYAIGKQTIEDRSAARQESDRWWWYNRLVCCRKARKEMRGWNEWIFKNVSPSHSCDAYIGNLPLLYVMQWLRAYEEFIHDRKSEEGRKLPEKLVSSVCVCIFSFSVPRKKEEHQALLNKLSCCHCLFFSFFLLDTSLPLIQDWWLVCLWSSMSGKSDRPLAACLAPKPTESLTK